MSRDPIEEEGGLNLYEYVRNNPVGKTDPSGLSAQNCPGKCLERDSKKQFRCWRATLIFCEQLRRACIQEIFTWTFVVDGVIGIGGFYLVGPIGAGLGVGVITSTGVLTAKVNCDNLYKKCIQDGYCACGVPQPTWVPFQTPDPPIRPFKPYKIR